MREVKPTQKPVPSSDIKDLFFNSGLLDIWATSLEHKYIDRFGNCHLTASGMEWIFNELVTKFKIESEQALLAAGYAPAGTFQEGAEVVSRNGTVLWKLPDGDGDHYRWDGNLPKQVPAGSTPQSTGGIGKGVWVSVGDASLRSDIKIGDGSLVGVGNRTLKDKLGEIATIVDYGGKAESGVDNAIYINAMQNERDVVIPRGVFEIASNITISRNVEFLNGAILKPLLGIVCTIEHDVIASNQLIFDLSEGGTVLLAGNANQYGLQEIKPYWFDIEKIGYSQIIRGRGAGLKAINNKAKMNYNHIDGFRAAENTAELIESTILGCFSGAGLVKGSLSTALGYGALRGKEKPGRGEFEEVTAINTTAAGQGALQDGATHLGAVAVGSGAGKEVRNSLHSVFIGNNVARLAYNIAYSDFIGSGAGYYWGSVGDVADNQYNVLFGYNTANSVKTGTRSTIIGSRSGTYSETCNSNTWIGYLTGVDSATYKDVSNSICIGDAARTRFNYTITIGDNITNSVEGRTHIGNYKTTSCLIRGIHELTTASSANVFVDPDGVLRRSTSSRKFKKHIREYELEWAYKVLEFKPIFYKPTEGAVNPDWTYYGYIAEQVAKIDPRYAQIHESFITNEQGELVGTGEFNVGGVMYDRIVVAQGLIIKDLLRRVEALEGKTL